VLTVRDLTVRFGPGRAAVDGVSLDLPAGEVLAVLGPSGCGKSTLLRAIAGLEALDAGSVTYDGRDLARTPTHRRGFALMFQDGQLFPNQDVAGNVGYPLRLRHTPRATVARRVDELLELVGLPGTGDRSTASPSSPGCCCSTSRCPPSTAACASVSPTTCATSSSPPVRRPCW
jgi:thiamine transport system ATP-binding protein